MKNITLLFALSAFVFGSTSSAIAFGGFENHEHPFYNLGIGIDQTEGDSQCQQIYGDLINSNEQANLGWSVSNGRFDYNVSENTNYVKAYDGRSINSAWHVWYHQNKGLCVANK